MEVAGHVHLAFFGLQDHKELISKQLRNATAIPGESHVQTCCATKIYDVIKLPDKNWSTEDESYSWLFSNHKNFEWIITRASLQKEAIIHDIDLHELCRG